MSSKIEELENKFIEQISESPDGELDPETNDTLDQLNKVQQKLNYMTISKNYRNECKYLLKLLGIPFIHATEDAEAFCVTLFKKGIVDYVYTEDTDIIPYFIATINNLEIDKPIKILRKGYFSMVTVIDVREILKKMNLEPPGFIDMCILSGCDFCTSIPKIGPVKAYTYMLKYKSIESLEAGGLILPENFKYQDARDIFFIDHSKEKVDKDLDLGDIDIEGLRKYLLEERKLDPQPVIDRYYKTFQEFSSSLNRHSSGIPPGFTSSGSSINSETGGGGGRFSFLLNEYLL